MITETEYFGMKAIQIENEFLRVKMLPADGSNLLSIFDKHKGKELLNAPSSIVEYNKYKIIFGVPVLFPPNRIDKGEFEFDGRKYQLGINHKSENVHIHGLVHSLPWQLITINEHVNEVTTRFNSEDYRELYTFFPHQFLLEMKISLQGRLIKHSLCVKNLSQDKMPSGIGFHTNFSFNPADSKLKMHLKKRWELNTRKLPTGKMGKANLEFDGYESLLNVKLDDLYPIQQGGQSAEILHEPHNMSITYKVDSGFTQWALFNASGKSNFLSVEPYSWVTNAPNLRLTCDETGFDYLAPGKSKTFSTEFSIEHFG